MEIPVIESGITRFQSPNLLIHLRTLGTWAALIIAVAATFSSLIKRSKRIILRLRKGKTVISRPSASAYSFNDDDDDVSCSSCSDDEEEEQEEEDDDDDDDDDESSAEKDFGDFEQIQGQNGKSGLHFPWPELARDGSVVKFWDGLGLGLDRSNRSISLLDLSRDEILRSFLCESDEIPAVHVATPGTFLSGGARGLKVWDTRAACAAPTASVGATWRGERLVGIGGVNNEVYVGDDVGELRVVDLRNVRSPLAETSGWCDGAVTERHGAGLASWCRNAARCLTRF